MKYWSINTDRDARSDVSTCDLWYKHNLAFAGDNNLDDNPHYTAFKKFSPNDIVFMHQSGAGIIGLGIVREEWDAIIYKGADRILYQKDPFEFRINVEWLPQFDRREKPLPITGNLRISSRYYSEIDPTKNSIADVINKLGDWSFETEEENIKNNRLAEESYYRETGRSKFFILRNHNKLSNKFCAWLIKEGYEEIKQENDFVDVTFKNENLVYRAELKICSNTGTRKSIREALGQLLEYNYYPGRELSDYWIIVLDEIPSKNDKIYVEQLIKKLNLPLFLCWNIGDDFIFHKNLNTPNSAKRN